jgi:uncharacterized iron-regulated membrane protein
MRQLRLLSTTATILLLGLCAVSAQGTKTNDATGTPSAAQQSAPPETTAPALKSDQSTAPDKIGKAAPTAPKSDKQLTTDNGASTRAVAKGKSVDAKSARTARGGHRRHFAGRYEGSRNGPLYASYGGHRGYGGCRDHGHSWTLGLWC